MKNKMTWTFCFFDSSKQQTSWKWKSIQDRKKPRTGERKENIKTHRQGRSFHICRPNGSKAARQQPWKNRDNWLGNTRRKRASTRQQSSNGSSILIRQAWVLNKITHDRHGPHPISFTRFNYRKGPSIHKNLMNNNFMVNHYYLHYYPNDVVVSELLCSWAINILRCQNQSRNIYLFNLKGSLYKRLLNIRDPLLKINYLHL